ncbi:MAG: protein-disulfide reductase DsbD domain-containing protein [Planctomycetota bacterium]
MATPVLLAEHDSFLLGGTTTVGIRFTIEPEWHIYWAGLNDTGFPVEAVWETPAGVEVGPLQWPVPKRYVSPGEILDYVYENEVTLLADVTVAADVRGPLEIRAALSWLACREACIPEDAAVAIALPVVRERSGDSAAGVSGAGRSSADGSAVIRRAREAMPIPLPSAQQDLVIGWASSAVLEIAAAGPATSIAFFPHETSLAFERPIETGATKGDRLRLHIDAGAPGDAEVMRGIVEIRRAPDATPVSYWIEADPRHASAADRTAGIRTWD